MVLQYMIIFHTTLHGTGCTQRSPQKHCSDVSEKTFKDLKCRNFIFKYFHLTRGISFRDDITTTLSVVPGRVLCRLTKTKVRLLLQQQFVVSGSLFHSPSWVKS